MKWKRRSPQQHNDHMAVDYLIAENGDVWVNRDDLAAFMRNPVLLDGWRGRDHRVAREVLDRFADALNELEIPDPDQ